MRMEVTITQKELEELIANHIAEKLPNNTIDKVVLYTQSTQNYKAKWEACAVILVNEEARQRYNEQKSREVKENPLPEIKAVVNLR